MFKVGDWVVYQEAWPRYRANQVGIVREVIGSARWPQEDVYIRVDYLDPQLSGGIEQCDAFRLHLGEGDIAPWDTEMLLDVPYGDGYNQAVACYWERRLEALCQNWKNDPCWDLENTPDYPWARERLVAFVKATKAEWEAEWHREVLAVAARLQIEQNMALADYIYRLELRLQTLSTELRDLKAV